MLSGVDVSSRGAKGVTGAKALKERKLNISHGDSKLFADDVMVSDVWRSCAF